MPPEGAPAPAPSTETPPTQPTPQPDPTPPAPPSDPTTPNPTAPPAGEGEGRVPYDRFQAVTKRLEEAEAKLKEAEEKDLGEKEKAERRAAEAETRATEAENRANRLERSTWARAKAQDLGFIDLDAAVALLPIESLDTQAKVENATEKLAESKPHLVGQRPMQGFGTPGGSAATENATGGVDLPGADNGAEADEDKQRLQAGRDLMGRLRGQR